MTCDLSLLLSDDSRNDNLICNSSSDDTMCDLLLLLLMLLLLLVLPTCCKTIQFETKQQLEANAKHCKAPGRIIVVGSLRRVCKVTAKRRHEIISQHQSDHYFLKSRSWLIWDVLIGRYTS